MSAKKSIVKRKSLNHPNLPRSLSVTDDFVTLRDEAVREIENDMQMICRDVGEVPYGVKYTDRLMVDGQGASLEITATFSTRLKPTD